MCIDIVGEFSWNSEVDQKVDTPRGSLPLIIFQTKNGAQHETVLIKLQFYQH